MSDKDNEILIDYQIVKMYSKEFTRFDHLDYYHKPFTVIDARFVEYRNGYSRARDSIESTVYKLISLNPDKNYDAIEGFIIKKLYSHMRSSYSTEILENDVKSVCKRAWMSPDIEKARKIYSKTSIIWKIEDHTVFAPTDEEADVIIEVSESKDFWKGSSKKRYLSKREKSKYINKKFNEIVIRNKSQYTAFCRSEVNNKIMRDKILPVLQDMERNGEFITAKNVAQRIKDTEDKARYYMKKILELAHIIERHNKGQFKTTDNRRRRKFENVGALSKAIRESGTDDKKVLHDATGISISSIYNLWREEDVQMALKNIKS